MSLRINQNVLSINTYSSVSQTSSRLEKSIQKLSSGLRINGAADDAAGLAISEKMRRQIRGLSRAVLNAQDGISMIQTAEGALNETQSILQRMRELAIQSSNDTLTSNDRLEIQKEVNQLKDEINRISRSTEFNTKKLLDGTQSALISSNSGAIKGMVVGEVDLASGDYDVQIDLLSGGVSQMQRSQIFTLNDGSGSLANGSTQLQSIAQFYDANGVFVLDTPQALTLSGNGNTTSLTIDGQMTLDNLSAAMQNSLVSKSGLDISNTRVATINTIQSQLAGVGGYIEIVSGSLGDAGEISVSSDQKVLDALGMSINREAVDSRVQLTLTDNFGNVRQIKTETDRAAGLLNGIDIQFESQSAQIAGTQGLEKGLLISSGANANFTVSAGESQVIITVGQGHWTMEGLARTINAQIDAANAGAGIPGLQASIVEGEVRLSYERPASASATVANTITIAAQSTGASTIGFLEGTFSGFVDAKKDQNMTAWGFSRYLAFTAVGNAEINVGDGINITTVVLTLTSAVNTADMTLFTTFQANFNNIADTDSVAVRVDQVGGAMVFTSLRVGTEHLDNQAANTSMVSVDFVPAGGVTIPVDLYMTQRLGITEGTVKGSGDANFKLHIVNSMPQYQIGADQGQIMKLAIAEMSSEALGVDRVDLTTSAGASKAIGILNKAVDMVSAERSKLGAYQNRLEYAINNLRNTHSNLTSAESRIRDTDIAMEMIEFTRNQIISQSGTAMLAQANNVPQGVLQLLR
ncbi:MAG: flagellin [Candidatus Rifleibacteriota bacterium]